MKVYNVISIDEMVGNLLMTIKGDGQGLKNGDKLIDENNNTLIIKSVAMPSGNKNIKDETILVIDILEKKTDIGHKLSVV